MPSLDMMERVTGSRKGFAISGPPLGTFQRGDRSFAVEYRPRLPFEEHLPEFDQP